MSAFVYVVEGKSGMYEPSFWTVNAWTSRERADAEAQRLNALAMQFWAEMQEFEQGYKDDLSDEELGDYFEGRDALIKKWNAQSGDVGMSTYEESEYYVTTVPLHE